MKKKILIGATLLALVIVGWLTYRHFFEYDQNQLILHGNVDIRQVNLGFRVGGKISEMALEEGDPVRAGQVIATLDQQPYQDQADLAKAQVAQALANWTKLVNGFRKEEIDQARAQLAQYKANLANAELVYERNAQLRQTNVISKQDMDNAQAARDALRAQVASAAANLALYAAGSRQEDIDAAKAQLDNARAVLESAELNLSDCTLVAPTDGVIVTRALEPGTIVAAGTVAYCLNLYSPIWIRTYIGERDLGRIYPGMRALIYTDPNPQRPYEGQIGFISPIAEFTPKTVETRELRTDLVFRLRVIVQQPDKYLRQGMPVTVRLQEQPWERALHARTENG
jgi:HlyD family secretion protein